MLELAFFLHIFRAEHLVNQAPQADDVSAGALDPAGNASSLSEDQSAQRPSLWTAAEGPHGWVVAGNASVASVVALLAEHEAIRVRLRTGTLRRLTRGELNGLAFRSWLFGIVSHLERRLRQDLRDRETWRQSLSAQRLDKAQELKAERLRRGQVIETVDCLQFADLAYAALDEPSWFDRLGISSRRKGRTIMRRLESLRNNLAHSQDVIASDWDTIVRLAHQVSRSHGEVTTTATARQNVLHAPASRG